MEKSRPVALVTGVGPGTGSAMVRRFARGGYAVAMLARTRERLVSLEKEIAQAHAYPCDVTDETQLDAAIAKVRADLGQPRVLIHNAVGGAFATFLDLEPEVLNHNFQINTMALLHLARRLAPAMVEAREGTIIVTGNTSALRGKPNFAGFAPFGTLPTRTAPRGRSTSTSGPSRRRGEDVMSQLRLFVNLPNPQIRKTTIDARGPLPLYVPGHVEAHAESAGPR